MKRIEDIPLCDQMKRDCWGKNNPEFRKPFVVPYAGQPRIMLITEQLLPPKHVPEDWDPVKTLVADIITHRKDKKCKGTIHSVDKILYGKLLQDFDESACHFKMFYWTHFIKCPGNLRDRKRFELARLDLEACADNFLGHEIRILQPRLILTMGKHASNWVLKSANCDDKWTDWVRKELRSVFRDEIEIPTVRIEDLETRLVVMPHPSGLNPLSMFNRDLQRLIKKEIDM
jgi:hypothetical protein